MGTLRRVDPTFVIGYVICEGSNKIQREEDLANAALMTLDGRPLSEYLDLLRKHNGNVRECLQAVDAGAMLR